MIVPDLYATCDPCADGNHAACLRKCLAMDDGGYIVLPTACGCVSCWGRRA